MGAALLGHHPIPSHMYLPACLPAHPEGRAKVHEMARGGLDWDPGPPLAARPCLPVRLPACLPAPSRHVKCVERRRGSLYSHLLVARVWAGTGREGGTTAGAGAKEEAGQRQRQGRGRGRDRQGWGQGRGSQGHGQGQGEKGTGGRCRGGGRGSRSHTHSYTPGPSLPSDPHG